MMWQQNRSPHSTATDSIPNSKVSNPNSDITASFHSWPHRIVHQSEVQPTCPHLQNHRPSLENQPCPWPLSVLVIWLVFSRRAFLDSSTAPAAKNSHFILRSHWWPLSLIHPLQFHALSVSMATDPCPRACLLPQTCIYIPKFTFAHLCPPSPPYIRPPVRVCSPKTHIYIPFISPHLYWQSLFHIFAQCLRLLVYYIFTIIAYHDTVSSLAPPPSGIVDQCWVIMKRNK